MKFQEVETGQKEYDVKRFIIMSAQPDPEMPFRQMYAVACMVKGDIDDWAGYLAICTHDEQGRVTVDQLQVPLRHCNKLPKEIAESLFGTTEDHGLRWRY